MITIDNEYLLNGKVYRKTFSDLYKIKKVGTEKVYNVAIDSLLSLATYEETTELLPNEEVEAEV